MRMSKRTIIIIAATLSLLGLGTGFYSWYKMQTGQVTVAMQAIPDQAKILFNGKPVNTKQPGGNSRTFVLHRGSYAVQISAPGYTDFRTNVDLRTSDEFQVTPRLQFTNDPTITSTDRVSGLGSGYTLSNVRYFEGQTWAILTLTIPDTDPAFVVAHYAAARNIWELRLGPGTLFEDTTDLPKSVQEGLNPV